MRRSLYFLGILNDSDIDWIVAAGRRREIPPGGILIAEGRETDSIYLVIDGAFTVRTARAGESEIARLMQGDLIGEMSLVDGAPPSATVESLDRSVVLALDRRRLGARLAEDKDFAARFYQATRRILADRLRTTTALMGAGVNPAASAAVSRADDAGVAEDALDQISLAAARFDWIQRRITRS